MLADSTLDRTARAAALRKSTIRARDLAVILQLWDRIVARPNGNLTDRTLAAFLGYATTAHTAALAATVRLVDAQVDAWLTTVGASAELPAAVPDDVIRSMRAGAPVDEILARPMVATRTAFARGKSLADALSEGRDRLESIVATNHQQSYRLAAQRRYAGEQAVTGYRRVLRGSENCLLCISASTQRYRSDRLMPIHPGCDCAVAPFTGAVTAAGTIVDDLPRLEAAQAVARADGLVGLDSRGALVNRKIDADALEAIAESQHGELGPLLKVARHRSADPTVPTRGRSRREFDGDGRMSRGRDVPDDLLAERLTEVPA